MISTISRGPATVRGIIKAYIDANLNRYLEHFRVQHDIAPDYFPDVVPENVFKYERDALDRWPQITISLARAATRGRYDMDSTGTEEFIVTYNVGLYSWVKAANTQGDALEVRDDFATALKWCLVGDYTLGDDRVNLDPSTITEDYSTATPVGGDRFIAAVGTTFSLAMDENNLLLPIGSADQVIVQDGKLVVAEQ